MNAVNSSQVFVPVLEVQFSCILQLSSDVANIKDCEAFGFYFLSFMKPPMRTVTEMLVLPESMHLTNHDCI